MADTEQHQQRIAFLYLNTGGGHIAPARALANSIQETYGNTDSTTLVNGFSEKMHFSRFFFENGYSMTCNYFEPGYVFFYQLTGTRLSIKIGNYFISVRGVRHLERTFRALGVTKVVCLHEVLIMMAREAIDRINPAIPLITVVTDPFTAHSVWFHEKNMELVVFSSKLRREAIERYGYKSEQVHSFPFILSRAYEKPYSAEQLRAARERLDIPLDAKVILIAGGGEGLKSADRLVAEFVRRKRREILIVVCGRNKILHRLVTLQASLSGMQNIRVFKFVSFMPDLINISDCVITKAGASTTMEVLALGKPIIFSTYIRGQELGNMLYVVYNGAGWYIKKPSAIMDQAQRLLDEGELAESMQKNIRKLGVRNGLDDLTRFIHDFKKPYCQ